MRKIRFLCLLLALVLAVSGCETESQVQEDKYFRAEEEVSTAFFDFTVTTVTARRSFGGRRAGTGEQLVVVELDIENTQDYTLPMGRYDFHLQWGDGAAELAWPLEQYCESQLPDQYDIPIEEGVTGTLVFSVPEEETDLALGFLEVFEDESQGDAYYVYFSV